MKRTLTLRREQLTELTTADLTGVQGGVASRELAYSCPVLECVSQGPTCFECVTRTCF